MLGPDNIVTGLNATADSFYSSQGRTGGKFDDRNENLISDLCRHHPNLVSLEMETFQLLDLARCSQGSIKAASVCIALAERYSNQFLDHHQLSMLERMGGTAVLKALTKIALQAEDHEDSMQGSPVMPVSTIDYHL